MGPNIAVPSGVNTPQFLTDLAAYQEGWEGSNVAVVNIENAPPPMHEKLSYTQIPGGVSNGVQEHAEHALASLATAAGSRVDAVIGVRYGTRGHAPRAIPAFTNEQRNTTFLGIVTGRTERVADAIVQVGRLTVAGDVVFSATTLGPTGSVVGCAVGNTRPLESDDDIYDAIASTANARGIVFVEPAGNGINWVGQPVSCYLRRAAPPAIMVGGAEPFVQNGVQPPTRGVYSNYGPRVDVAAPGGAVNMPFVTVRVGNLLSGSAPSGPQAYSDNYNATSAASSVTSGAFASTLGIFQQAYGRVMGAPGREIATLRDLFSAPGSLGVPLTSFGIGVQPDYSQNVYERILATRFSACGSTAAPPFNAEMLVTVGNGIDTLSASASAIPSSCAWRWNSSAGSNRVLIEEPAVGLVANQGPLDLGHNPGESYTVEARIRVPFASTTWQPIVAKEYLTSPGVARNFGLWITPQGWGGLDGRLHFSYQAPNGTLCPFYSNHVVSDWQPHHVAVRVTSNGLNTPPSIAFFIDGSSAGEATSIPGCAPGLPNSVTDSMFVGGSLITGSQIGDVRLYHYAANNSRIAAHAANTF